ncbi:MAG: hypothetical protein IPK20_17945 [Betaproteobacteria bacterium]|nr:hypothetical protein [Betaproteobacteria bacterium]
MKRVYRDLSASSVFTPLAHHRVAHTEVLRDLLHGVVAGLEGGSDRTVSVALGGPVETGKQLCHSPALDPRDLPQVGVLRCLLAQTFGEVRAPQ